MRTCGIDASTTCTGWSIFENNELIAYGAIKPDGEDWRDRLFHEGGELSEIFKKYKPNKIYMEDVPLKGKILKTLVILGAVQGFIYGIAGSLGIPVEYIGPTAWRSKAGLFDGTEKGKERDELKRKAIEMANKKFNLNLNWTSPKSKKNEDDIAEAILICAVMNGTIGKRRFGK